jgi:hypothetical protein
MYEIYAIRKLSGKLEGYKKEKKKERGCRMKGFDLWTENDGRKTTNKREVAAVWADL